MAPDQYECKDCEACWAEWNAKRCINCLSKDISIVWRPKGRKYDKT
jgi:hypothetical protein